MMRLRRYRVFVVCAVFTVIALYEFTSIRHWSSTGGVSVEETRLSDDPETPRVQDEPAGFAKQANPSSAIINDEEPQLGTTATAAEPTELDALPETTSATSLSSSSTADFTTPTSELLSHVETVAPTADPVPLRHDYEDLGRGEGRLEAPAFASKPAVHWKRFPERYPVLEESAITLPTANPIAIPRIQHEAQQESAEHKAERESRLAAVKEAMNHTWTGYRNKAWMADEVRPISGDARNPFCGWAATLVDSLDTLWIMGFEEQFEEAAKAVSQIDFTTTMRDDIPLFETTIRYLGGLLGAYDVGGGKHRNLLDKAVELADVLMGAFDTPNRMPVTYYWWKPEAARKPHRAGSHAVLSELGSLSVEFTRLAQITKEHRYYDAVARITNEFEAWQNHTRLPGMWPIEVDASGCRRVATPAGDDTSTGDDGTQKPLRYVDSANAADSEGTSHEPDWASEHQNRKRQLETVPTVNHSLTSQGRHSPDSPLSQESDQIPVQTHCEPQGLSSPSDAFSETFTLGGQSDSLYEYLPKEYLLLGGAEPKYQTMYEQAVEVIKKNLLFRPMTLYERDVLHSGALSVAGGGYHLLPEITHLTCFAGGMLGMAAKIFNRPDELELASKFAESCVWAYDSTQTGIMPEGFIAVACTGAVDCAWNQTRYWEAIDPYHVSREEQRDKLSARKEALEAKAERRRLRALGAAGTTGSSQEAEAREYEEEVRRANNLFKKLKRRQLGDDFEPPPPSPGEHFVEEHLEPKQQDDGAAAASLHAADQDPATSIEGSSDFPTSTALATDSEDDEADEDEYLFLGPLPPTHEEYVRSRIEEARMPPGFVSFQSTKYILRPEAIESVFYMYRITGDVAWQEKGWRMFESIQKYTRTRLAYSAIEDVTSHVPLPTDEMESFWAAETLKYFFLLFSEVDVLSLDEWVLNTEAHPFKRPQPQPESPTSPPPLQPPGAL